MLNIYHNKMAFLSKKPKKLFVVSLFMMAFLLIVLIFAYKLESYDHYLTKGYVDCEDSCLLVALIPTNIEYQKIKLNNKDWNSQIKDKELEVDEDNMISYYRITFSIDDPYMDKEIVDLNFYYNKQRILVKLKEKIF